MAQGMAAAALSLVQPLKEVVRQEGLTRRALTVEHVEALGGPKPRPDKLLLSSGGASGHDAAARQAGLVEDAEHKSS